MRTLRKNEQPGFAANSVRIKVALPSAEQKSLHFIVGKLKPSSVVPPRSI